MFRFSLAAPVTLILIAVIGWSARDQISPEHSYRYHARVFDAVTALPDAMDGWSITVLEAQPAPDRLPNVHMRRQFDHPQSAREATVKLIQYRNPYDLCRHDPVAKYRDRGWILRSSVPQDWRTDDMLVHGVLHEFVSGEDNDHGSIAVYSFIIHPNGRIVRDQTLLRQEINRQGPHVQLYGAARFEMTIDLTLPTDVRRDTLIKMIEAHRTVIEILRSGARR